MWSTDLSATLYQINPDTRYYYAQVHGQHFLMIYTWWGRIAFIDLETRESRVVGTADPGHLSVVQRQTDVDLRPVPRQRRHHVEFSACHLGVGRLTVVVAVTVRLVALVV